MTKNFAVVQETIVSVGISEYFEVTPKGLVVTGNPSFDACEALWETLRTFERCIQMSLGDAAKYFRKRFGDRADQILSAATGWSDETQRGYEWVAEKVPEAVRRLDVLTFSHHQKVAALPPPQQKKWLDKAAEGEDGRPWSVARLDKAIKAGADQAISEWGFSASFADVRKRDDAMSRLEGQGARCRAWEKRGP